MFLRWYGQWSQKLFFCDITFNIVYLWLWQNSIFSSIFWFLVLFNIYVCITKRYCYKFRKVKRKIPLFFNKKETPTQVFSWEFCEICENTFLQNTSRRLLSDSEVIVTRQDPVAFLNLRCELKLIYTVQKLCTATIIKNHHFHKLQKKHVVEFHFKRFSKYSPATLLKTDSTYVTRGMAKCLRWGALWL